MGLGERFILYITEQSILIPTSSLLEYAVNVKATLLTFFLFYSTNFGAGIKAIFETRAGMLDLLILFLISLAYYSIESVTGLGIAKYIFKREIISKYEMPRNERLKTLLVRDVLRAFFISNLIDALFILRNRKMMQGFYDG